MPTVRTTMQPHLDIEVSDAEYLDLERQGLLVDRTSARGPEPASSSAAAPAKTPSTVGKSSKE